MHSATAFLRGLSNVAFSMTYNCKERVNGPLASCAKLCYERGDAGVAELVDAPDLGSGAARRGGSSPFTRTTIDNLVY